MTSAARRAALARLRARAATGIPIIGAGVGSGLTAKAAVEGGADFVVVYNSGRYRIAGRETLGGLMPYGDANATALEMAHEVVPVVPGTPVVAGVCATDPFRVIPRFLTELATAGVAGVQNYPTVGLIDGVFRESLENAGLGFDREIEMIGTAAALGLLACPYVFDPDQAARMAVAGADVIVAHLGLSSATDPAGRDLDRAARRIQDMRDAAAGVNPDLVVVCHGPPVESPAGVAHVLARTDGVAGFFGSTSLEGAPIQRALAEQVLAFASAASGAGLGPGTPSS